MADVLFISESDIKTNSSISNNLSPKLIMPYVTLAQQLYLKPQLGKDLYNSIIDEISASTISTANNLLITQTKKTLTYYSIYEALPFIRTRIEQAGVVFMTDDTYQAVSDTTFFNLRKTVKNYAESYMADFLDWLDDNKSNYPLFNGCITGNTYDYCGLVF